MKLSELKPKDQREFLAAFAADPLVRKMEDEFNTYSKRGQYIQAIQMRAKIEDVKQVADCVCYIDGVRYTDKNNAWKINAGLDVINTICAFHKVNAPIFIDNAESVNKFIPVASQLITLVVTNGNFAVNNL